MVSTGDGARKRGPQASSRRPGTVCDARRHQEFHLLSDPRQDTRRPEDFVALLQGEMRLRTPQLRRREYTLASVTVCWRIVN